MVIIIEDENVHVCFYFSFKYFYFDNLGQKPDGSASGSTTLEIRKIPVESNTISKLNEHFSRFGTVTNVQVFIKYLQFDRMFCFISI